MKTWTEWLDEIGDDCGDPLVYDRFDNEVEPWWGHLTLPTDEAVLAEIGDEPVPDEREEAAMVICDAFGRIMQREQNQIDEEAEEAEYQQWLAKNGALDDLYSLVSRALNVTDWRHAATGSCYAQHRGLSIRVSDHQQVAGGGWNEGTGDRNGEVDLDFHLDDGEHDWTEQAIRLRVAAALRDEREVA